MEINPYTVHFLGAKTVNLKASSWQNAAFMAAAVRISQGLHTNFYRITNEKTQEVTRLNVDEPFKFNVV